MPAYQLSAFLPPNPLPEGRKKPTTDNGQFHYSRKSLETRERTAVLGAARRLAVKRMKVESAETLQEAPLTEQSDRGYLSVTDGDVAISRMIGAEARSRCCAPRSRSSSSCSCTNEHVSRES